MTSVALQCVTGRVAAGELRSLLELANPIRPVKRSSGLLGQCLERWLCRSYRHQTHPFQSGHAVPILFALSYHGSRSGSAGIEHFNVASYPFRPNNGLAPTASVPRLPSDWPGSYIRRWRLPVLIPPSAPYSFSSSFLSNDSLSLTIMFTSTIFTSLLAVSGALASPVLKRDTMSITDTDILQYALTLEHLENTFYSSALAQFDDAAFVSAGFEPFVRKRFVQIAEHEKAHVDFLTLAIGANATKPCEYSFPYNDPKSFASLSMVLEGVGVTAYLGAAQYITNKNYLTAAGSILTTEARHAAWVASAVNMGAPWSGPLDVPLDLDQVYSLAAAFISNCPSTNPALPVKAFPGLTYAPAAPTPGSEVTLTFSSTGTSGNLFLAVFTGLSTTFLEITNDKVTLPATITGTAYAVVSSNGTMVSDDTTIAGPAIMIFPDNM